MSAEAVFSAHVVEACRYLCRAGHAYRSGDPVRVQTELEDALRRIGEMATLNNALAAQPCGAAMPVPSQTVHCLKPRGHADACGYTLRSERTPRRTLEPFRCKYCVTSEPHQPRIGCEPSDPAHAACRWCGARETECICDPPFSTLEMDEGSDQP
jgi:hypothetical protein